MTKFVPRHTYEEKPDDSLAKSEAIKALSKGTAWPGEAKLGVKGRVDHPGTDGAVRDLSRIIISVYRSLPKDSRLATESEKREHYQRIVAALEAEDALTDSTKELALLLAGLDSPGDQVTSPPLGKSSEMADFMVDFRRRIAVLQEQIAKLGPVR